MAWSWNHAAYAYDNARENLGELDHDTLCVIYAEWRAAQGKGGHIHDCEDFCMRKYERALKHAKTLPDDVLADFIWERASEHATCDNGGFNAWMCPSGCHTVPFSQPEEDEDCFDESQFDREMDD